MSPARRQIDESDRSDDLHQPLGDQLRDAFGLGLDHHADERLGAGGAHEDAALAAQELLLVRDGGLERIARHDGLLHAAVVADDDVQQHLRVLRAVGGEHGRALAGEREDLQELERGELTVAGGGVVGEDHVARLLAAELVAALHHLFEHIAVAHVGADEVDAVLPAELVQSEVRHDGRHDGVAGEPAVALHIGSADRHDLVAVDLMAQLVDHQAAVGVAVEGHAHVVLPRHDALAEAFEVRGAAAVVDVRAVRLAVDEIGIALEASE